MLKHVAKIDKNIKIKRILPQVTNTLSNITSTPKETK